MIRLLSIDLWLGIGAGAAIIFAWAVLFHGPAQFKAGGIEKAAELDSATKQAAKDLTNAAEAHRLARRVCLDTGGVFDLATGQCIR